MELRFISTLTPDDEERFAAALLAAVGTLLDAFSIAYTLKIQTNGNRVLQRTHPAAEAAFSNHISPTVP